MPTPEGQCVRRHEVSLFRSRHAGFTLVELMVTLIVLGIVMAIAIPSFTLVRNNARLSGSTNELVASLQQARMEAIRLNRKVSVCRSDNGSSCASGELWSQWITLADTDRNGVDEVLKVTQIDAPVELRASASAVNSKVQFSADGLARKADGTLLKVNFAICMKTSQPADNQRTVTMVSGSRVSTKSENKTAQCQTPGDPA